MKNDKTLNPNIPPKSETVTVKEIMWLVPIFRSSGICYPYVEELKLSKEFQNREKNKELVDLLGQLEEEGFADQLPEGFLIPWSSLYALIDTSEYSSSISILGIPEPESWRPVLSSNGSLTDPNFSVTLAGWIYPKKKSIFHNYLIEGAIITCDSRSSLLPRPAWETIQALEEFHKRPQEERNADSNRRSWAAIRRKAVAAESELSDFLLKTIVITPERLKLSLRKKKLGESKTVEIIPTFDGAPARWLSIFDRLPQIQDRYEIPDGEGLCHVIIPKEVKTILTEIKRMPGRRVAGERAEAFIRNPFASLGPDADKVLDPEEFERSRDEAGISFARFTVRVLRDNQGFPFEVALIISESLRGEIETREYRFEGIDKLKDFVSKLEDRVNQNAQCCFWEGFDLEILGDTPDQLSSLKKALNDRIQSENYSHTEIFDLSRYSERVMGFGVEKPYYSPFIARKNDSESWFPDNIVFGLCYTPEGSDEPVAVSLNEDLLRDFKRKLQQAKDGGKEHFIFPGFPKPVRVNEADEILNILGEASKNIQKGTFDPTKTPERLPIQRKGLVVKPNIESLDYSEARGALALPNDAIPLLSESLKPETHLKDHQVIGIAWLQHLWNLSPEFCRGAVLADDMGLGKTLQLRGCPVKCVTDIYTGTLSPSRMTN